MDQQDIIGMPSRVPQQGRSLASFERMLKAAEQLMVARGSDEFTLTEVSKIGRVSIGSIYNRFKSKDELIHSVQARALERFDAEQHAMLDLVRSEACDLETFTRAFVDRYAESLKDNAALLRPFMMRALSDSDVSLRGKRSAERYAAQVSDALMSYQDDIGHADPERAIRSAYRVIYATLARYLGLGSSSESSGEGDWQELKDDLGAMCAAFLRRAPVGALRADRADEPDHQL